MNIHDCLKKSKQFMAYTAQMNISFSETELPLLYDSIMIRFLFLFHKGLCEQNKIKSTESKTSHTFSFLFLF